MKRPKRKASHTETLVRLLLHTVRKHAKKQGVPVWMVLGRAVRAIRGDTEFMPRRKGRKP